MIQNSNTIKTSSCSAAAAAAAAAAALSSSLSMQTPTHQDLLILRETPRTGRGWFAQQAIPAGRVVCIEEVSAVATTHQELVALVQENLPAFDHLYHPPTVSHDQSTKKAHDIVRCNHFAFEEDQLVLLFHDICLFNHSCNPNASVLLKMNMNNHDTDDDRKASVQATLQAARSIAPGEEITISYLNDQALFWPYQPRHHYLHSKWGFDCRCDRCRFSLRLEQTPCHQEEEMQDHENSYLLQTVWPLLEQAAAISAQSKPRARTVDPICWNLQQEAAEAVSRYLPHLKQGERFQADVDYFS